MLFSVLFLFAVVLYLCFRVGVSDFMGVMTVLVFAILFFIDMLQTHEIKEEKERR